MLHNLFAVHRFNDGKMLHRMLGLVGLQVADQMPNTTRRQYLLLVHGFLDPVFPHIRQPCRQCFRYNLRRMIFGHRQNGHLIPRCFLFLAIGKSLLNLGLYLRQIFL